MNSLERVLAALAGTPQPRPPFTLTLSLYGARLTGCHLTEYYRIPERYAEGQEAVMDLCSPDILFSPFALTLEAQAFGSELKFLPDNPPNIRRPAVRSAEAFLRLPLPDAAGHPSLLYLRESVRRLAGKINGTTPVCGILTAPVDLPAIVMGIDMWIETLIFFPEMAAAILEMAQAHFVGMANALLADGANFIGLTTVFSNPQVMFPKMIDTVILPALARAFREVQGPIVFHHGGNPMLPYLEGYLALPNVAAFAIDHRDSLSEARHILGPGRLLLGNLNGLTLSRLPRDKVLEDVGSILADRKDDPCFIFSTAAADVPWDTPPELIQAISGKIRAFARER
jgi:uroporphyrinogen decarboxylase